VTYKNDEFEIEMRGRKWAWAEQAAPMLEIRNVQKALFEKKRQFRKVRKR
jgi:hypothetical protein